MKSYTLDPTKQHLFVQHRTTLFRYVFLGVLLFTPMLFFVVMPKEDGIDAEFILIVLLAVGILEVIFLGSYLSTKRVQQFIAENLEIQSDEASFTRIIHQRGTPRLNWYDSMILRSILTADVPPGRCFVLGFPSKILHQLILKDLIGSWKRKPVQEYFQKQ